MYERPQLVARLIDLLPLEQREEVLISLPRERAIIEELMLTLKATPLTPKIEAELKKQFAGRLFF
jgi:hypothetical protein